MTRYIISDAVNWYSGPYTAYNAPWGAGSLVWGTNYTDTTTLDQSTFPNGVLIAWSWPEIAATTGVYNFDQVEFGDYYGTVPQTAIPSSQINGITSLSETFNMTLGGETPNYDVITDMFLTVKPGDNTTNEDEIEVFLHTPQYAVGWTNSLAKVGTFTGSGHTWEVALANGGTSSADIIFMPTDTNDVISGSINLQNMFAYLVQQKVLTGSEYFNGLALGSEVHQGTGSLAVNNFLVGYSLTPPAPAAPSITSLGTLTNVAAHTVTGTAEAGSTVKVYDNANATALATVVTNSSGIWSTSLTLPAQGANSLTATATDSAGNVSPISAPQLFTLDTLAPKPVISIITGNRDGGVTLAGVSEANSIVSVADTVGGKTTSLGSVQASSTGAWQLTSHALVNMSTINSFSVSAVDPAGNTGAMKGALFLSSTGVDTLTGTAGVSDVFAIMSFHGSDVINDFQAASVAGSVHDYIDFSGRGITSFGQVQQMMSGTNSAVITIGSGKTITFTNVAPTTLTASDFRYS